MVSNLTEGANYRIEGNLYWLTYPIEPAFFQGHLVVLEGGRVQGVLMDRWGPSRFKGHFGPNDLGGGRLNFRKEYDIYHRLYRGGSPDPIEYELALLRSGGYSGFWTIPATGDMKDRGVVTLAIVPWEDTWPLLPGLFEFYEQSLSWIHEPVT